MEMQSGRRLRRSSPPPHGTRARGMDLISALHDEMLLLVLARLRCVRAAAQTSLLSRRWRGLWLGLSDLTFRGLAPDTIEALLRRFAATSPQVSTLDIGLPPIHGATGANSLLRAAARLSPGHLAFTLDERGTGYIYAIELPCFERATSIDLDMRRFWLKSPPAGEFTALESLSVTGHIIHLEPLLIRCPRLRLRVLSITQTGTRLLRITLPPSGEFPMLEKLTLSGNIADLGVLLDGCPRLRVLSVTLRGMELRSLTAALAALEKAASLGLVLSTLGVGIPWREDITMAFFTRLLGTVERLSPQELVVADNFEGRYVQYDQHIKANLPCFAHATSIEMSLRKVCFKSLEPGEFSMLERLSLPRLLSTVDIGKLVNLCPRLRVLKVTVSAGKITVHSASLQKLDLNWNFRTKCRGIEIVTPQLKELHVEARTRGDMGVSILAPMVENVLWQCSYTGTALVFGSWCLQSLRVQTTVENVLCLHLDIDNQPDAEVNFAHEVEKLPITNFSVLEINFKPAWHVYGPLVLQLLRMHRIRVATKKLKVFLLRLHQAKQVCLQNCRCDKSKNWRRQSIFSTSLEEVEIKGFNGEDHEYDFLRLVLKCSPMLKGVSLRWSHGFEGFTTELSNIALAYPSVEFASS